MTPSPPAFDRFGAGLLKPGATLACGSRLSLCTPPRGCSAVAPSGALACPSSRQHSGWGGWLDLPIRFFRSGSLFMFSCCRACSVWRDFHPRCDLASPDAPSRSCRWPTAVNFGARLCEPQRIRCSRMSHGQQPLIRRGRCGSQTRARAPVMASTLRGGSPRQAERSPACNRRLLRRGNTRWRAAGGEQPVRNKVTCRT